MSVMAGMLAHALEYAASLGPAGWAVFILLYAVSCAAFLPVSVLTLGAGAVFGLRLGFVLVWTGAALGACASFLIGRHWLRSWVEKRLAKQPVFHAIDAAVSRKGFLVVFLTRLAPLFPFSLLNYAYGITRVRFGEYALASIVGMLPGTLMFVYAGAIAGDAFRAGAQGRVRTPLEWAFYGLGLLATIAVVTFVGREARRALAEHAKLPPL